MAAFKSFFSVLAVCITILIMYFTSLYHKCESANIQPKVGNDTIVNNIYNACMEIMMNESKGISFEVAKNDCKHLSSITIQ